MRKREHLAILASERAGHNDLVHALRERIVFLEEQNADLLNRAMSQDWTQYTALSAIPQEPIEIPNRVWDPTGLIEVEVDDE
jgi:hypothetical protein